MSTIGQASFSATTWEETPYIEIDGGRKLTRVHAVFAYTGQLEGQGTVDYLMAYAPDGTGNFVGLEHITGRIGDRTGSFVAQHTGIFDPKSVTTRWEFVPGLGTEAFEGLVGSGNLRLEGHGPYLFQFEYEFENGGKS
jgi:hypothetical protein